VSPALAGSAGPLAGRCVMVTRARHQAKEMIGKIEALGGKAFAFPLLKTVPVEDTGKLDQAIGQLDRFDWVIFTSVNGVRFFWQRLQQLGRDREAFAGRVAAVGPKTAAAIREYGLEVEPLPSDYVAEGLLESLREKLQQGQRVLLPRADIARKQLPQDLRQLGLEVTEVDVYHTVIDAEQAPLAAEALKRGEIDAILFTSSSTVNHFVQAMSGTGALETLDRVKVACIGPITAQTARQQGLPVHVVAETYTVDGLLEALIKNWEEMDDGKQV